MTERHLLMEISLQYILFYHGDRYLIKETTIRNQAKKAVQLMSIFVLSKIFYLISRNLTGYLLQRGFKGMGY